MMGGRIRHCPFMFIAIPSRQKSPLRWATPLLFAALWGCFTWATLLPDASQRELLLEWGALSGGLTSAEAWQQSLQTDAMLRLGDSQKLYGYRYRGETYDCGSPEGFVEANVAFALARSDLAAKMSGVIGALLDEQTDAKLRSVS